MTEAEWLACTNSGPMLDFLQGKASERKLRLFAVACCRQVWGLLSYPESRQAVEVAERLADGQATEADRWPAYGDATNTVYAIGHGPPNPPARLSACAAAEAVAKRLVAAYSKDLAGGTYEGGIANVDAIAFQAAAAVNQVDPPMNIFAALVRDVFGNPFRPAKTASRWLAWNDGTIPKIAQAIYDDRAFDRLPILADALEDAGSGNADILAHCRNGGEHVRGCWVVDLLLGKQ
jgi:hypothetical protein